MQAIKRIQNATTILLAVFIMALSSGCVSSGDRDSVRQETRLLFGDAIAIGNEIVVLLEEEQTDEEDKEEIKRVKAVIRGLEEIHTILGKEEVEGGSFGRAVASLKAAYEVAKPYIPEEYETESRIIRVAVERALVRLEMRLDNA